MLTVTVTRSWPSRPVAPCRRRYSPDATSTRSIAPTSTLFLTAPVCTAGGTAQRTHIDVVYASALELGIGHMSRSHPVWSHVDLRDRRTGSRHDAGPGPGADHQERSGRRPVGWTADPRRWRARAHRPRERRRAGPVGAAPRLVDGVHRPQDRRRRLPALAGRPDPPRGTSSHAASRPRTGPSSHRSAAGPTCARASCRTRSTPRSRCSSSPSCRSSCRPTADPRAPRRCCSRRSSP